MVRRIVLGSVVACVCGIGAVAALPRVADELPKPLSDVARLPERVWTRVFPPRVSRTARLAGLTEPERAAVAALARRLDGWLVWSSNRSGHHELYLLDVRAQSVRQLTHTPSVNFFARFSPDGTHIVFVRSQREWVSVRDPTAWDVYLIRVEAPANAGSRRAGITQRGRPTVRRSSFIARHACSATI